MSVSATILDPSNLVPRQYIASFYVATKSISDDGRYVASVDVISKEGRFALVTDRLTGTTTKVLTDNEVPGYLAHAKISGDGSKLVFACLSGDNPRDEQIYLKDLATGKIQLVSSSATGVAAEQGAYWSEASMSDSGRYVIFANNSSNLVANDNNHRTDIFMKDTQTGAISLISQTASGEQMKYKCYLSQVSQDAHYVMYLHIPTSNGNAPFAVFVKDTWSGELQQIASSNTADGLGEVANYNLSRDGSKFYYVNDSAQLVIRDRQSNNVTYTSIDNNGKDLPGTKRIVDLSADYRYALIDYTAPSDHIGNFATGFYRKDLQTGTLQLLTAPNPQLSLDANQSKILAPSILGMTPDGQHVIAYLSPQAVSEAQLKFAVIDIDADQSSATKSSDDILLGNSGEHLAAGPGNDQYWLTQANIAVLENSNEGTDTANSLLADYSLPLNVENLTLLSPQIGNLFVPDTQYGSGNALNNILTGNSLNNVLRGMDGNDLFLHSAETTFGNDVLDGGNGSDTVRYTESSTAYKVEGIATGLEVRSLAGYGTDLLQYIERIEFADKGMSLAGDTQGAQAYRIYQAALNRAPDASGLGFWIKQIDKGATLASIAQGFIQSSEFSAMYGQNPSNADLVSKIYQNVLHRAPDADGLQYWVDILDSHRSPIAQVLADFSESSENQAALVGVIGNGFTYTPYSG